MDESTTGIYTTFCHERCVLPAAQAAIRDDVVLVVDSCGNDDLTPAGPVVVASDLAVLEVEANGGDIGPGYPITLDDGRGAYVSTPPIPVIPDSIGPEGIGT